MSRRFIITLLGFSLALFLIPQIPLAAEDHIAEAITHTKQAIDHGKTDMPMSSPLTLRPR